MSSLEEDAWRRRERASRRDLWPLQLLLLQTFFFSPQPSHRAVAAADCEVLSLSPFAAAVPFA